MTMSYNAAQRKTVRLLVKAGLDQAEAKALLHDAISEAKDILVIRQFFKDKFGYCSEED